MWPTYMVSFDTRTISVLFIVTSKFRQLSFRKRNNKILSSRKGGKAQDNQNKFIKGAMERRYIILYCIVIGIVLQFASSIHINGTIPHISIQCKAPVVGYSCTVMCHVRDFRQPIAIFCPLGILVGRCFPKKNCTRKDGYTIEANYKKNVIFLNIPRLNANHSGQWLCTYGGGATSKPEKLQVRDLPTERSPSRYITLYEGESISLHCDFDYCDGCYDIKWYKDGNELQRNDTEYKMDSPLLVILNIKQKHRGVYMCSVTTSGINIRNGSNIIIYSVRKIPNEISSSTHDLTAVEGGSVTLHCDTDRNAIGILWNFNGHILDIDGQKYDIKNNGQRLHVHNLNKYDIGTYVCYRGTQLQGPKFNIYSMFSIPKRDCPNEIPPARPYPPQQNDSDSGQGLSQLSRLWNMLVWILVLITKFGFCFIYLLIFGFSQFYSIAISLFREEEAVRIRLCRWIVVLAPALTLIMTPTSITAIEDIGVFLSPLVIFILTALLSRYVFKPILEDHDRQHRLQVEERLLETHENQSPNVLRQQ